MISFGKKILDDIEEIDSSIIDKKILNAGMNGEDHVEIYVINPKIYKALYVPKDEDDVLKILRDCGIDNKIYEVIRNKNINITKVDFHFSYTKYFVDIHW